jgi:hypothetical protein
LGVGRERKVDEAKDDDDDDVVERVGYAELTMSAYIIEVGMTSRGPKSAEMVEMVE